MFSFLLGIRIRVTNKCVLNFVSNRIFCIQVFAIYWNIYFRFWLAFVFSSYSSLKNKMLQFLWNATLFIFSFIICTFCVPSKKLCWSWDHEDFFPLFPSRKALIEISTMMENFYMCNAVNIHTWLLSIWNVPRAVVELNI